jgi:hypothetical protein
MEAIFEASSGYTNKSYPLPTIEDVENFFMPKCQECGYQGEFPEVSSPLLSPNEKSWKCPGCDKVTEELPETEAQEIFEWWIVTEWLYRQLKGKGEPVLEWGNNYYWGRCTTGQAILLDGVISSICWGMEILDGQANSWAKKEAIS